MKIKVTLEDLEAAYVGEYERGTWPFESESRKQFVEYRDGLTPVE